MFPLLEPCVASAGTMKASLQGEGFQVICSSLDPLGPVPNVHSVFSNRSLCSTSGGQPRATEIAYHGLEVSWKTLTNNSKEGFSCPLLEFLLDSLWRGGGSILTTSSLTR